MARMGDLSGDFLISIQTTTLKLKLVPIVLFKESRTLLVLRAHNKCEINAETGSE